jgi:DNA-binding transcriptional MerR regulator
METGLSQLLDQKQASQLLGLSPRTLEAWRLSGGGPVFIKAGRRVLYHRNDLEVWLNSRRRSSTSDLGSAAPAD